MNFNLPNILRISLLVVMGWMIGVTVLAQTPISDSLIQVIQSKKIKDTALVDAYNDLAYQYRNLDIEKSLQFADTALQLAQKKNYIRGVGNAYVNRGNYYKIIGNSKAAKDCYVWAYVQHKKIGNLKGISSTLNCIASLHFLEGNLAKALVYFIQSLNISHQINDRRGEAITQNNIGVINLEQRNFSKALEYYEGAYNTFKQLNDKNSMADCLNNIGNVYHTQGVKNEALKYYGMSLNMFKELGNTKGQASVLNNLGIINYEDKAYKEALKYYHSTLKLEESLNDKQSRTITYSNIANCYYYLQMHFAARQYANMALTNAIEQNDKIDLVSIYEVLAKVEDKLGNYKDALAYMKLHHTYRDSLYSEESRQKLEDLEAQYEAEKAENERLLDVIHQNEGNEQKYLKVELTPLTWSLLVGSLLALATLILYVLKRR